MNYYDQDGHELGEFEEGTPIKFCEQCGNWNEEGACSHEKF